MAERRRRRLVTWTAAVVGLGVFLRLSCVAELQGSRQVEWAMEAARADPRVVSAIGSPVEKGWIWEGSIDHFTPGGGISRFIIPLHGPKGRGTLRAGVFKMREYDFEASAR